MNAEAKNLKAITDAMTQHALSCGEPLTAILMNSFELDRLGWDEIRGVPIQGEPRIQTGRFELVCAGQHDDGLETVEAVADQGLVTA